MAHKKNPTILLHSQGSKPVIGQRKGGKKRGRIKHSHVISSSPGFIDNSKGHDSEQLSRLRDSLSSAMSQQKAMWHLHVRSGAEVSILPV